MWIINDEKAHCLNCTNVDDIEAWEPIYVRGYRIKRNGKK